MGESRFMDTDSNEGKELKEKEIIERISKISDYLAVREYLMVRTMSTKMNELFDAVYVTIGDIALVLYIILAEQDDSLYFFRIRRDQFSSWGRKKEEVMVDALLNTQRIAPPRIYHLEALIVGEGWEGEDFMDPDSLFSPSMSPMGDCLSTSKRLNGAVAIFYPGIAPRLSALMGESFYLAFTSAHEVMIHRESQVDPGTLKEILTETIRETTDEKDVLTYEIYRFDKDEGIIYQIE